MRTRFFAVCLLASACEADAPPPLLPLDEALDPGQVRAGVIAREPELSGGATAQGRLGDFKIYNSKVRFVLSAAGRGAGYNPYGGTVVDADVVRVAGAPGRSAYGEVLVGLDLNVLKAERIEVVNDGRDGKAARIRVHGKDGVLPLFDVLIGQALASRPRGLDFSVEYVLEPDAEWLRLEYRVFNGTSEYKEVGGLLSGFLFGDEGQPFVPNYGYRPPTGGEAVDYFGSVAGDVSYLYGRLGVPLHVVITRSGITAANHGPGIPLREHDSYTWNDLIVVGDGDLNRSQSLWNRATAAPAYAAVSGRVAYASGEPVEAARVHAMDMTETSDTDYRSTALTAADGRYTMRLPPGMYRLQVTLRGHLASDEAIVVLNDADRTQEFVLDRPGFVRYAIVDDEGRALPAKITAKPAAGALTRVPDRYGDDVEPLGVSRTEYAISGAGRFEMPSGSYRLWVSRGGEYAVHEETLTVRPAEETLLSARLSRVVDTTGWMSTDTHVHAQMSPDSRDLYPFKVSALVVEGLELPISTEHEAIGDFNPAIRELGLEDWIQGVVGSEITTFVYGHFNAWPLVPDPTQVRNGPIDWYYKPPADTFRAIRANAGRPFLQVNHPRSLSIGGYFSAMDYDPATGRASESFSRDFDGIEVWNGCPHSFDHQEMTDWFSFLNRGERKYALGSSDSHGARKGDLGYPRTYVRMPTDDPKKAQIADFRTSMLAGHMVISCGPFLEVSAGDAQIGDTVPANGTTVALEARVAAPPYIDVDALEVVVNGQVVQTASIAAQTSPTRWSGTLTVPVPSGRDSWIVVRVRGDAPHSEWARARPSLAFTNPIFVDGDGDGGWTMR